MYPPLPPPHTSWLIMFARPRPIPDIPPSHTHSDTLVPPSSSSHLLGGAVTGVVAAHPADGDGDVGLDPCQGLGLRPDDANGSLASDCKHQSESNKLLISMHLCMARRGPDGVGWAWHRSGECKHQSSSYAVNEGASERERV